MKRQIMFACAAGILLGVAGCGRLVSSREYLNTAMSPSLMARAEVIPVVAPPVIEAYPAIPRRGLVLPDLHEEDVNTPGPQARAGNDTAQFARSVQRKLQSLDDALMRMSALACQKGSAGIAAMDSKVRSFRTSAKLIDEYLLQANDVDSTEWSALKVKINSELRSAAAAVWEAMQVLQRLHDPGHLICQTVADPLLLY